MIEQLKKIFPSLQYFDSIPAKIDDSYSWFLTEDSHVIGIKQNEVDAKNKAILNTFLKPLKHLFPLKTEEELKWEKWIHQEDPSPDIDFTFRFVYFSIPTNQIEPAEFKDAMNQLFAREIIMLWVNDHEGILVEIKQEKAEETISYHEIIDILMSDLYVNIKCFVGPYLTNLQEIKQHYNYLISGARTAFSTFEKNVITFLNVIPAILLSQTDAKFGNEIQSVVLQEFQDDKEFLEMIEVFLESNLNISVAAKKLYMHRNSLQYRIDKFHEKTGIDVREFHQALTVYLAILAKNM